MNIYMISDLHLGHANIIKYCGRPFDTVEEMDRILIRNWNNTVSKGDIIYFLGDFCMGGFEKIKFYADQLNGRKRIILGNHDRRSNGYIKCGFEYVFPHPIIIDGFYMLSHEPMFLHRDAPYVNIHGHMHQIKQELIIGGKNLYYNVCVEMINYTPINFEDIKNYYNGEN